jgi:hypothetical protein
MIAKIHGGYFFKIIVSSALDAREIVMRRHVVSSVVEVFFVTDYFELVLT